MQLTGSFKLCGTANRMLQLTEEARTRSVVAVSSGNHDRAVAYITQKIGIPVLICVCDLVQENKCAARRSYGADLRVVGKIQDDAQDYADGLIATKILNWVSLSHELRVIAGQGTVVTDMFGEQPDVDTVVSPFSGGLISGIVLACRSILPSIKVVGGHY